MKTSLPAASRDSLIAVAMIGAPPCKLALPHAKITPFLDSDDFLLSEGPYAFDFYLVCLQQRGVPGSDLIRLIRRSSDAGIMALSPSRGDEGYVSALEAGADTVLREDAPLAHLQAAIAAVRRRVMLQSQAPSSRSNIWQLIEASSILQTPDGRQIALSEGDMAVIRCFAKASEGRVERKVLTQLLWADMPAESMENALHATMYRLRKRIERYGGTIAPLRAVPKVGYEFKAPLLLA